MVEQPKIFFTDAQLCQRWNCSHMKLWRRRKQGRIPRPIKIAGVGRNLTPASVVKELEVVDLDARLEARLRRSTADSPMAA